MNTEKLQQAIAFARENGLKAIEVDGIRMEIPQKIEPIKVEIQTDDDVKKALGEDPFIDMTDEEILFFHSDYFDELRAQRLAKQEALIREQQVKEHKEVKNG